MKSKGEANGMKQSGVRGGEPKAGVRELHLTRSFDAPPALVWKAWTDPHMVAHWWGPRMFDTPLCELEVRPGGAIRIHMRGPDGAIYPMTGLFHEVVEPERLVFTAYAYLAADSEPILETLNSITFEESEGKTKLAVDIVVVKATPEAEGPLSGMEQGWNEQLDRLAELVLGGESKARGAQTSRG